MEGKIVFILFAVLVLGLVIYSVQSGFWGKIWEPINGIFSYKTAHWFSAASSTPAKMIYTPPTPATPLPSSPSLSFSSGNTAPAIATSEIPTGFSRSDLSPYFKKITLTGAWAGTLYSYGQITLGTYNMNASDTVDITGWQIKTSNSGETIPQAVGLYDPSGLTAPSDIFLGQNQYVDIYSSAGPFNLRMNECIGYIGNSNHFTPALPVNCPYTNQSAIASMGFTGACENYIYSLGSCQAPNLNDIRVPINDYACRDYLANNFNYKSCFNAHVNDANFLSNEWRVWMGSSPLDQYHDTVQLFDKKGLLVDQYSY
jgi:hypothetical protein